MAIDTFLVFDGKSGDKNAIEVKGETTDATYKAKNGIQVLSWSFGASNPVTIGSASSGMGAGKVSLSSFSVMKMVDKASPMLFLACCSGSHFPKVSLECRKAGAADGKPYLVYEMTGVFIESVQESASSEEGTESVSMAFETVIMKYAPQKDDGKLDTPIPAGWDVKGNVKK